jgi:hypothetical protein
MKGATMERREHLKQLLHYGGCMGGWAFLGLPEDGAIPLQDEDCRTIKNDKEFIQNWLTDLMNSIDSELDDDTKQKVMAGRGKGCFDRHKFKQDIAAKGKGNLDNLIAAYKTNFEIWKAANGIHIRYGEVSKGCCCPAARYRPAKPNDLHCECTRNTHKTVFETALGKPVEVHILVTVRRGGKTCHFVVHV